MAAPGGGDGRGGGGGGDAPALQRTPRKAATRRLRRLLGRPELSFLGPWRGNASYLRELGARLAAGGLAVIQNFLAEDVARSVLEDTLRGISMGWLRPVGEPLARLAAPGLSPGGGEGSEDAGRRCRALHDADARVGFKFRYHVLDPRGRGGEMKVSDFPGHVRLYAGLASQAWTKALFLLLTGSEVVPEGATFEMPYYREYRPGDYALLHNDMDGSSSYRALCFNYWLPTPSWDVTQGGGFLWCGPQGADGTFAAAERVAPAFNSASLFAPSERSWHAVDVVEATAAGSRRLSFTSWLHAPRAGAPARAGASRAGDAAEPVAAGGPGDAGQQDEL